MKIVLGALIVFLSAAASVRAEDHRLEVSGGYVYLADHTNAKNVPRGWSGGIGAGITSSLAIAGEVGGSYLPAVDPTASGTSIYSFLAGPRYVIRVHERVRAFGQFLIGDVHASAGVYAAGATTDHLAYQPGGGVDIAIAPRWSARLQGGYQRRLHVITTFVSNAEDPIPEDLVETIRGFHERHWTDHGMCFWVVSDLNAEELAEFASLIRSKAI